MSNNNDVINIGFEMNNGSLKHKLHKNARVAQM